MDIEQSSKNGDWHPADIVASLRKAGWSLRRLSAVEGYRSNAVQAALYRPAPVYERIIADALGLGPEKIWPNRYNANGTSKHKVFARRVRPKANSGSAGCHGEKRRAA